MLVRHAFVRAFNTPLFNLGAFLNRMHLHMHTLGGSEELRFASLLSELDIQLCHGVGGLTLLGHWKVEDKHSSISLSYESFCSGDVGDVVLVVSFELFQGSIEKQTTFMELLLLSNFNEHNVRFLAQELA